MHAIRPPRAPVSHEAPDAEQTAGLFDRYRPGAILALPAIAPTLEESQSLCALVRQALPDFLGDEADVAATVDEAMIRATDAAAASIDFGELRRVLPALGALADAQELDFTECLVLAFLVVLQEDPWWEMWCSEIGAVKYSRMAVAVAGALRLSPGEVRRALHPEGRLAGCGLIDCRQPFRRARAHINEQHNILADIDLDVLRDPVSWAKTFGSWFGSQAADGPRPTFPHLEEDCRLICEVLERALQTSARGTHVLLYGPPGTGKTTLAGVLSQRLGAALYEVRRFSSEGWKDRGEKRLRIYDLGQRQGFGAERSLMLFDELEDLLPARWAPWDAGATEHKGWICGSLECARIPTIWTTNSLFGIDQAILRRFSFILEVGVPPLSVRRRLLDEAVADSGIREVWCERTAQLDSLTPAMTVQLATLATSLPLRGAELECALDRWLEQRLKAMHRKPLPPVAARRRFRCELLNIDPPAEQLVDGLSRAGEGRLCLHGPPGTGKTAFANYLADRLDRPALVKRGSDLRSCYVGQTEQNIAGMFAEATREGAVLILDEANGFLSARSGRSHRWEMNEVGEFLVQLEDYRGIFCATTNRFEDLDPAFMRRFDLKVRFGYLNDIQRELAMRDALRALGCSMRLSRATRDRLARLEELAPGDFAVAGRRLKFSGGTLGQAALLSALVHEVECKNIHEGRPIGFRWGD